MLSAELLGALEREWQRLQVSWFDDLLPGLPDDEIDALAETAGLRIPAEARQLWRWHDATPGTTLITPCYQLMRLTWAIRDHANGMSIAAEMSTNPLTRPAPPRADEVFRPSFLAVFAATGPDTAAVDCAEQGDESPLYFLLDGLTYAPHPPGAPSIESFLTSILELYRADAYSWDGDRLRWVWQGRGTDPLTPPALVRAQA
jgi:hypothetical protein